MDDPVVLLTADGHEFAARPRPAEPGVYDFDWLTGPPGHGFTTATSDGSPLTEAALTTAARSFLAGHDPAE